MKRMIYALAITLSATLLSLPPASASTPELAATTCKLEGELSGLGLGFIWGGQIISGDGEISCRTDEGVEVSRVPVQMQFISGGFGFDFSIINSMVVESGSVRVSNGPNDLVGSFSVGATAGMTLIDTGIDFDVALKLTKEPGLALELAVKSKDVDGLGARLHAMTFIVTPKAN